MFVLICNRVVKRNTGATAKFAPRSANNETLHVSGPFATFGAAQKAALAALSTHTCLDAQILGADQVAAEVAKGSTIPHDRYTVARRAADLLAGAPVRQVRRVE